MFEDLIDCKRILREIAILSKLSHNNVRCARQMSRMSRSRPACLISNTAHMSESRLGPQHNNMGDILVGTMSCASAFPRAFARTSWTLRQASLAFIEHPILIAQMIA